MDILSNYQATDIGKLLTLNATLYFIIAIQSESTFFLRILCKTFKK